MPHTDFDLLVTFGRRLRVLRVWNGLSEAEMARRLGVSVRTLKGREAGKLGSRGMMRLAVALGETFGVSVDWMLGHEISAAYRDETWPLGSGGQPLERVGGVVSRRRKKVGDAPVVMMLDPLEIEALKFYRAADDRTKAAMTRFAERMAIEKMPVEIAAELYELELAGADPDHIAAWRRQRWRIVTRGTMPGTLASLSKTASSASRLPEPQAVTRSSRRFPAR